MHRAPAPSSAPADAASKAGGLLLGFSERYNAALQGQYGGPWQDAARGKGLSEILLLAATAAPTDPPRPVLLGDLLWLMGYHISFGLAVVAVSLPNAVGASRIFPGLKLLCSVPQLLIARHSHCPSPCPRCSEPFRAPCKVQFRVCRVWGVRLRCKVEV